MKLDLRDEREAATVASYRVQAEIEQFGKDSAKAMVSLGATLLIHCSERHSDMLLAEAYLTAFGF